MIETERLRIVPCDLKIFDALAKGKEHLGILLSARVPDSWPLFPESISYFHEPLKTDPELLGWGTWIVIDKESNTVIGEGGYGGKPGEEGQVEIGYGITPEQRGKGLATEFAQALITQAFSDSRVTRIEAGTLKKGDEALASMRVLEKLGFSRARETESTHRWELTRG